MNAAAKALAQSNWVDGRMFTFSLSKHSWAVLLLMLAVLVSALAVIYVATLNRQLCSELQAQQQFHQNLQIERSQLLLEQSTFATQARVLHVAKEELQMVTPEVGHIVVVKD